MTYHTYKWSMTGANNSRKVARLASKAWFGGLKLFPARDNFLYNFLMAQIAKSNSLVYTFKVVHSIPAKDVVLVRDGLDLRSSLE